MAAATAGVALVSTAHADVDAGSTIPGTQSGSVSVLTPTRTSTLRTSATKVQWISHKDCVDDIQITFTPSVSAPSSGKSLVAFVSSSVDDCLQNSVRGDITRCKPLTVTSGTASLASPIITFKASELTELMAITSCGDDVATAATGTSPVSLKFYFLLSPPSQDLVKDTDNFAIFADSGIDLWGPPPPTDIIVLSGDEALEVSFTDGANGSSDRVGYYIYVDDGSLMLDPDAGVQTTSSTSAGTSTSAASSTSGTGGAGSSSGTGGAGGAGGSGGATSSSSTTTASSATSTASAGGSSTTAATTGGTELSTGVTSGGNTDPCNPTMAIATCVPASYALIPGWVPSDIAERSVETGNTTSISGLKNGTAYVVSLAAYDDVGNIGAYSELGCETPIPVDSILRVYECKNGLSQKGCGFCSIGGDRGGSFAALVSAGLVAFGLAARRSRRRGAVGSSRGVR